MLLIGSMAEKSEYLPGLLYLRIFILVYLSHSLGRQLRRAKEVDDSLDVDCHSGHQLTAQHLPSPAIASPTRSVPTHQLRKFTLDLGVLAPHGSVLGRLRLGTHPLVLFFVLVLDHRASGRPWQLRHAASLQRTTGTGLAREPVLPSGVVRVAFAARGGLPSGTGQGAMQNVFLKILGRKIGGGQFWLGGNEQVQSQSFGI